MAELSRSVEDLKSAVAGVADRVGELSGGTVAQLQALQSALEAERAAAADLAAAEDAEDVEQNAALEQAQAEVDRLMGEVSSATSEIDSQVAALNDIATGESEQPPPVEEPPVEEPPVPDPTTEEPPAEEPPAEEEPTEDPEVDSDR